MYPNGPLIGVHLGAERLRKDCPLVRHPPANTKAHALPPTAQATKIVCSRYQDPPAEQWIGPRFGCSADCEALNAWELIEVCLAVDG